MVIQFSANRKFWSWISSLGLGLLLSLWLALPSVSAERIYANFGPLERFVSVESLVNYAQTGDLGEELEEIQRFLNPEQLEQLRNGLTLSADVDVVTVSQFLYTAQGEAILDWLGGLIQTVGRQNGALAIRGAMIQATADREGGLNVLNFLKHFPTTGVRVDLQALVGITRVAIAEINQTNQITAQLFEQTAKATASPMGDFTLGEAGTDRWEIRSFEQTTLPADLYLPDVENAPMVVLSHGLGGNRETLAYLAEHLASHGFAAAVVEHPGSSDAQLEALLSGKASEAVEPEEMTRRPTDIQAFLDELEAIAQS
ncbi:MAG: alpha/beta hydrolase, partial [Cyanobacteria bacterium P01_G01_bin.38]